MKKLVLGMLAHVDTGKTTLSEGLLYLSGAVRRLGRVDHRDAFLDTDAQERERGITIFSKQAEFSWGDTALTLLDTPGHVDFSAEMERTLSVLDCAVLVISGTDGIQGHTRTLWRLLERHAVPTFLFVNKMDLPGADKAALLAQLQEKLDGSCLDFSDGLEPVQEDLASLDEGLMDQYLEGGRITEADAASLAARRLVFPCFFGSALKLEGVEKLLDGLSRYTLSPSYPTGFGARVFKIARDGADRLTYVKITGGSLKVRTLLREEKVNQIRIYSGAKYQTIDEAPAGTVCALTGLTGTRPGDVFGVEPPAAGPELEPVLTYQVIPPPAATSTLPSAISASWRRRTPSSGWFGTKRWGRFTSSSWGRFSWRCSPGSFGSGLGRRSPLAPGTSSTGRPSPMPWRGWATSSPCGTTPRSTCCWSPAPGAADCASPPPAPPTSWT